MSWVSVRYHPASFFSLRPANATASGGKTLLIPTGFAIKMALLNASIQTAGLEEGVQRFAVIRDLRIALGLPPSITVLKSFAKIRRPARIDAKARDEEIAALAEKRQYPFQSTIAYREFVQLGDPTLGLEESAVEIACATPNPVGGAVATVAAPEWLGRTLLAVNYLGKRGGFWQPLGQPVSRDALSGEFIEVTRDSVEIPLEGTLQLLDDCGERLTFEQANIYSEKRIGVGVGRVFRHVALPYRLERSSRGYSRYVRLPVGQEEGERV